jgi:hypothetical protein
MIKHNILFIGLDTHKTFTEVAYIEDQRGAKSTHLGKIRDEGAKTNCYLSLLNFL